MTKDRRTYVDKRFEQLKSEATTYNPAWKELSMYINPTRGYFGGKPNRGQKIDHQTLLDSHATHDSRILASGMQSGVTSPTKPWIKLNMEVDEVNKIRAVRVWLDEVARRMHTICANTNVYDVFYQMYEEIADFGTACGIVLEDPEKVIRLRNFTIGEYYLGLNSSGRIDSFAREFWMTVDQVVEMFGIENCSDTIQTQYNNAQYGNWAQICHLVEKSNKKNKAKNGMEYVSNYWEYGNRNEKFLGEGGFEEFPCLAPRWDTITTDMIYGYGPGWHALGNIKQLQKTQLDKLLAQEKIHNPPMQADGSVDGAINTLPGGITRSSSNVPNSGVRPAYQINADLQSFIELINSLKKAIDKDFFADLFLMIASIDRHNVTATEIAAKESEKIMMMGPVLAKLQSEMLDPFVERLFAIMSRNGLLPDAPPEIEGMSIKIEYVSILAQAQKALGVNSINRVIQYMAGASALNPEIVDGFDFDESLKEVADMEGVPAKLLKEQQVIMQLREQRAQAQQMQQQMMAAASMADTADKVAGATNKMAGSPMNTGSALDGLTAGMQSAMGAK